MEPNSLVAQFVDNVVAQRAAMENGDAVLGNACAERYITAFNGLRAMGDEGRDQLSPLLFDRRPVVRVTAAAFLLRHRHAEAKAVLDREAEGQGILAFEAEQALKRWTEGTWALDPE